MEDRVNRPSRGADGERLKAIGWRNAIYAPIRSGDRLVGVLSAGSDRQRSAAARPRDPPHVVDYATLAGALLGRALAERRAASSVRLQLEKIIETSAFTPVFQPIVDLTTRAVVGYEALTRIRRRGAAGRAIYRGGLGRLRHSPWRSRPRRRRSPLPRAWRRAPG